MSDHRLKLKKGFLSVIIALLVITYGYKMYHKEGDLITYREASLHLISGSEIYRNEAGAFVYPPFAAFLMIPFAELDIHTARGVLYITDLLFIFLSFQALQMVIGPYRKIRSNASTINLVAILLTFRFFLSAIDNQQTDLILLAFSLMSLAAFGDKKYLTSGIFLAAAISIKLTPLLFIPYFLLRKSYRTAVYTLLFTLIFFIIPEILFPADSGVPLTMSWYDFVLSKIAPWTGGTPWTQGGGIWAASSRLNQSLSATVYRFLVSDPVVLHDGRILVNLFRTDPQTAKIVAYTLSFSLVAVSGLVMFKTRDMTIDIPVDLSIIFCLMLLLSPQSSKAHFSSLLLPHVVLLADIIRRRNNTIIMMVVLSVILNTLSAEGFIGMHISDVLEACGVITFGTLLLWCALIFLKVRKSPLPV